MSPRSINTTDSEQPETRTFGRFLIEAEVGRGAFGNVYKARDPQLDRVVAIKIPRFNSETTSKQRTRFLIEAKAAASLHHPNIVAVYDAGTIEQQLFIASAFIDGCSLRTLIKTSGRPSQAAVARMVMKIADALAYAHSQGIIHRDIKPENILVNKDGEPFITDFGLARIQDSDSTETRDGAILGTLAYMSPEQAEGQANKVDGRTDLWSLGVILYELLAGKRPFEGGDIQILYSIRYEEPAELRQINSQIDRDSNHSRDGANILAIAVLIFS